MKRSNKILLGGFLFPIVVTIMFIVFMSFNRTDEVRYQMIGGEMLLESNDSVF